MDTERFELFNQKLSPSGRYICNIYQDKQTRLFTLELITKVGGFEFYHLPEDEEQMTPSDIVVWGAGEDVLFYSTGNFKRVHAYDIPHRQTCSKDVPDGQVVVYDGVSKLLFKKKLYSDGKKDYYSTEDELAFSDCMAGEPAAKVLPLTNSPMTLWLRKKSITQYYGRDVWQIAVCSTEKRKLLTDDIGLYAIENSIRSAKEGWINFYGYKADEQAFFWVNYHVGEQEIFVLEYPDTKPIMDMRWVEKDGCWRAIINGEVISPRPFYYDNLYSLPVKIQAQSIPLELLELIEPGSEEVKRQRAEQKAKRLAETKALYEANNTSADDLIRRASGGESRFWQGLKMRRRERTVEAQDRKRRAASSMTYGDTVLYFVLITLLFLGMVVGAVMYVAYNGYLGPVAMRNIFSSGAALFMGWVATIINMRSHRGSGWQPLSRTGKIVLTVFCLVVVLAGLLICVKMFG